MSNIIRSLRLQTIQTKIQEATSHMGGKTSISIRVEMYTRRPMVSRDAFHVTPLQRWGCQCNFYNRKPIQPSCIDLTSKREFVFPLGDSTLNHCRFPVKLLLGRWRNLHMKVLGSLDKASSFPTRRDVCLFDW